MSSQIQLSCDSIMSLAAAASAAGHDNSTVSRLTPLLVAFAPARNESGAHRIHFDRVSSGDVDRIVESITTEEGAPSEERFRQLVTTVVAKLYKGQQDSLDDATAMTGALTELSQTLSQAESDLPLLRKVMSLALQFVALSHGCDELAEEVRQKA